MTNVPTTKISSEMYFKNICFIKLKAKNKVCLHIWFNKHVSLSFQNLHKLQSVMRHRLRTVLKVM